ncbi:MAG TPA: hypothetical protein VN685_04360, partial [Rhizomicrobium sp.]|nr:hypothetical protein [Rhizomicrobium sp.]
MALVENRLSRHIQDVEFRGINEVLKSSLRFARKSAEGRTIRINWPPAAECEEAAFGPKRTFGPAASGGEIAPNRVFAVAANPEIR